MLTSIHRWAVFLIAGALGTAEVTAANPQPAVASDSVTVLFQGKRHILTGKQAEVVREAALDLLRTSCEEIRGVDNDADDQQRYERAKKRSHILITFAKHVEVPKAGNNRTPVRVESLMVPFSPDLNPETVYVLPGKPFRPFTRFIPEICDTIRESLVKAGIYPAGSK